MRIKFPQVDAKSYFVVLHPYIHHDTGCVLNYEYYLKSFLRLVEWIDGASSYHNVEALFLQCYYIFFDICTCTILDNTLTQSLAIEHDVFVRYDILRVVTVKTAACWDVTYRDI
jgi:hypothetical protein